MDVLPPHEHCWYQTGQDSKCAICSLLELTQAFSTIQQWQLSGVHLLNITSEGEESPDSMSVPMPHEHYWYQTGQGSKCVICSLMELIEVIQAFQQRQWSGVPPLNITSEGEESPDPDMDREYEPFIF